MLGNAEALLADPSNLSDNANALMRAFHTLKGMGATMNYACVTLLAHALEDVCQDMREGHLPAGEAEAALLNEGLDALRAMVAQIDAGEVPEPDGRLEARIRGHRKSGTTTAFQLLLPAEDDVTSEEPLPTRTEDAAGAIAELLSACGQLRGLAVGGPPAMAHQVDRVEEAARALYGRLVELRQVPFGSALPPLRRHLRSLCRQHGIEATLETQGEDVLVDPELLAPLQATLVQLLHNAAVHGIECPEERVAHRKPRAGRVLLRIERGPGALVIEFSDDGRGLDGDALRRAAKDPGGDPVHLALQEGISTAARLDHHAGRGQGLPTVQHGIERLGGLVEVYSVAGRGLRVVMEVPVQADLTDVLLVEASSQTLGLLGRQARSLPGSHPDAPPMLDLPVDGAAAVDLRGLARPVRVDRVLGTVRTLVRPAPFPLSRLPHLVGTAIGPDGRVLLVVDPVLAPGGPA